VFTWFAGLGPAGNPAPGLEWCHLARSPALRLRRRRSLEEVQVGGILRSSSNRYPTRTPPPSDHDCWQPSCSWRRRV